VAARGRNSANDRLAAELAAGATIKDAAAAAGVSERTGHRRLEDPEFCAKVDALRMAMLQGAVGQLAGGTAEAAQVLRELLKDKDPNTRGRFAVKLIELAVKMRDHTELERRIADLEAQRIEVNEQEEP
jgi:hypothetical protein